MSKTFIRNALIVNEKRQYKASVLISGEKIEKIFTNNPESELTGVDVIDAKGKYLLPGFIDEHVHFREPGLTHKADMSTESAAAVAGGVTSVLEMPNTNPKTTTTELLNAKLEMASTRMLCNYGFFLGASGDNLKEICGTDTSKTCGVKLFLATSTGNMQVENKDAIIELFKESPLPIIAHCEDETIIAENLNRYNKQYDNNIPFTIHHLIRDEESCYRSCSFAVEQALKYNTLLHIAHISTDKEVQLIKKIRADRISAEVCIPHLYFTSEDYALHGSHIKCNPSIKSAENRESLITALADGTLLTVASDHAPHTLQEKENQYTTCPSGIPMVQHSFYVLSALLMQKRITLERIVECMCHAPAVLFGIENRGFIREGYYADLVLADINFPYTVTKENTLYKCGWTPLDGSTFPSTITHTWVNGHLVYENGKINIDNKGKQLRFNH